MAFFFSSGSWDSSSRESARACSGWDGGSLCLLLVFVLIIIIIFLAFVPFHYHTSHSESLEVTERMDVPVSALSVKLETLVVGLAAVDGDSAEL